MKKVKKSKMSIDEIALVNIGQSGKRFGSMMADGHQEAIDVSVQTVDLLRSVLLDVNSAFTWKGGNALYSTYNINARSFWNRVP